MDDLGPPFGHDFPLVIKSGPHTLTQDSGHRRRRAFARAMLPDHSRRGDPLPELIPFGLVLLSLKLMHWRRVFAVVPPLSCQPAMGSFRAATAFSVAPVTLRRSNGRPTLAGALTSSHCPHGAPRKRRQGGGREERCQRASILPGGSVASEGAAGGRLGIAGAEWKGMRSEWREESVQSMIISVISVSCEGFKYPVERRHVSTEFRAHNTYNGNYSKTSCL